MASDNRSGNPARLVCVCGQRMAIEESMYGEPGKCPACRQKLWMPYREEVEAFGPVVHVAQHRELLREPGQRVRAQADPREKAEAVLPRQEGVSNAEPAGNAVSNAETASPAGAGEISGKAPGPSAPPKNRPSLGPDAPETTEPLDGPPRDNAENVLNKSRPDAAETEDESQERPATGLEDRPIDPQPALQVILSAIAHFERKLEHLRKDPSAGRDEVELQEGLLRLARAARWKLEREFRSALVDTSDALRATLKEISRTVARFRAGSLAPDEYFMKIAALRERREVLERKRVNLRGWLRAERPSDVGGPVDKEWEDVDFDAIRPVWPAPPSHASSLLTWLTDSLREALRARREAEIEEAEWLRARGSLGETNMATRESALRELRSASRMANDRIEFLRLRLREILMDIHTDIEALNDYGRVAVEKAGGPDTEEARAIAERLAAAGADLRKQRIWARDALAALFPEEVPGGPVTLFRNLGEPEGRQRFSAEMLPALMAAFLFLIMAFMAGSWVFSAIFAGVGFLAVPTLLLRTSRLRAAGILGLWALASIPSGMVVLKGINQNAMGVPALIALCSWLSLGTLLWIVLRGMPRQQLRFVVSATLVLSLVAAGILAEGVLAFSGDKGEMSARAQATNIAPDKPVHPPENPSDIRQIPLSSGTAGGPAGAASSQPPGASPVSNLQADAAPSAAQGAVPADALPSSPGNAASETPPAPSEAGATSAPAQNTPVTAELRGVMRSENRPPRFKIVFQSGNGEQIVDAMLGDRIFGLWSAKEFNAEDSTLVLANGGRLVVLRKGIPVELPDAP